MTENQTIKERLIAYIKYLGIGQAKFEKKCGLSNGYINNIRRSISPEKLQTIALTNPELNTGWLMTGEGEMLRPSLTQNVKNSKNFSQSGDVHVFEESATSVINKAMDEIAAHRRMLEEELKKKIDPEHIETQIKDLNDRVNSLIEQVQALNDYLHQKYN
jgi:transcriptional regulator with XRE-family HTH domain